MIPVRVEPEARAEIREAARWYEEQEPGLSGPFLDEIEGTLMAIEQMPRRFARITGFEVAAELRRALLKRFPYSVVFMITPAVIAVIAVMHARRKPGYFLYRVTSLDEDCG